MNKILTVILSFACFTALHAQTNPYARNDAPLDYPVDDNLGLLICKGNEGAKISRGAFTRALTPLYLRFELRYNQNNLPYITNLELLEPGTNLSQIDEGRYQNTDIIVNQAGATHTPIMTACGGFAPHAMPEGKIPEGFSDINGNFLVKEYFHSYHIAEVQRRVGNYMTKEKINQVGHSLGEFIYQAYYIHENNHFEMYQKYPWVTVCGNVPEGINAYYYTSNGKKTRLTQRDHRKKYGHIKICLEAFATNETFNFCLEQLGAKLIAGEKYKSSARYFMPRENLNESQKLIQAALVLRGFWDKGSDELIAYFQNRYTMSPAFFQDTITSFTGPRNKIAFTNITYKQALLNSKKIIEAFPNLYAEHKVRVAALFKAKFEHFLNDKKKLKACYKPGIYIYRYDTPTFDSIDALVDEESPVDEYNSSPVDEYKSMMHELNQLAREAISIFQSSLNGDTQADYKVVGIIQRFTNLSVRIQPVKKAIRQDPAMLREASQFLGSSELNELRQNLKQCSMLAVVYAMKSNPAQRERIIQEIVEAVKRLMRSDF